MKRSKSFFAFLGIIIFVLTVLQVVVSNKLSTTGITLGTMQDEIANLRTQNSILSEQLVISTSFHQIATQAGSLGFAKAQKPLVLSAPVSVARN